MVMKLSERKDSNPRHAGYKPAALDQLSYVPKGVGGGLLLTRRLYGGSHQLYAFGFMVHYNILKTNIANKTNKLLIFFHKSYIFHPNTIRCGFPSHSNCHFIPG